ncbi:MAG: cytochrome-c oxidase, cbb3-type subunit III [Hyphomicrobium sp.]|jgi:cytochrome c oxidase cbb3-type subunit 3
MTERERDTYTGHMTTGHQWNGIKELNSPIPKTVWFFYILFFLCAVVMWILWPAFPLGTTFTKGVLGIKQHTSVDESVVAGAAKRSAWEKGLLKLPFNDIQAEPSLMNIVRQAGPALFGDNCAVCHGLKATGGPGFPDLVDESWLWGGTPDKVMETISVGVNSSDPDTRSSQMPAFGRDQMLEKDIIVKLVGYVRAFADGSAAAQPADTKQAFIDNCSGCHGEDGKGNSEMGAPNLTDKFWLYGGSAEAIQHTIWGGRQGHMPSWKARLTEVDRKILTLYVLDLANQNAAAK